MPKQIEKSINKSLKFRGTTDKLTRKKSLGSTKKKRTLSRRALKNFGIMTQTYHQRACLKASEYCYYTFQVYQNNIFCTLKVLRDSKFYIISSISSGKYKVKLSRKSLKQRLKFVLFSFLKETNLKKKRLNLPQSIAAKVTAPIKLKSIIIKLLKAELKKKLAIVEVARKYIFNGCRARKKVRKKRKGLRLLK